MTDAKVVRRVDRPSPGVAAALGRFGVATLHEAQGKTGLLAPYLRPLGPGQSVAGPALTVLVHPGDNLMIHAAVAVAEPGDVLVVAASSVTTDGMFGELLATSARAHGIAGLVIDAGVRDSALLGAMQFPVWSKAVSAQGTAKARVGSVNVPVVCAGTLVAPGDIVVADDDGVVCVPSGRTGAVLEAARQRESREEITRQRLARGELGMDIYGLWQVLEDQGVVVDRVADRASSDGTR